MLAKKVSLMPPPPPDETIEKKNKKTFPVEMTPLTSLCAPAETRQHSGAVQREIKMKGVTRGQITIWSWTRRSALLLAAMDINMCR